MLLLILPLTLLTLPAEHLCSGTVSVSCRSTAAEHSDVENSPCPGSRHVQLVCRSSGAGGKYRSMSTDNIIIIIIIIDVFKVA